MKLNVVGFTVSDSTVALDPETFTTRPLMFRTVSVVRVTSVAAAKANEGANSATTIPARASIRGIVSCYGLVNNSLCDYLNAQKLNAYSAELTVPPSMPVLKALTWIVPAAVDDADERWTRPGSELVAMTKTRALAVKIGRASCRERV